MLKYELINYVFFDLKLFLNIYFDYLPNSIRRRPIHFIAFFNIIQTPKQF